MSEVKQAPKLQPVIPQVKYQPPAPAPVPAPARRHEEPVHQQQANSGSGNAFRTAREQLVHV